MILVLNCLSLLRFTKMSTQQSKSPRPLKWYNSVRTRFFLAFSALVASIAIFIYLYFPARLQEQALSGIKGQAASFSDFMAFSLSPAIFFDDEVSGEEVMEAAKLNPDVAFVQVIGKKGENFAHYGDMSLAEVNFKQRKEERISDDGQFWLNSSPIDHQGTEIGRVFVGHSLAKMKDEVQESKRLIAIISLLTLLIGVSFVYWVSTLLTRNLSNIVSVVNQIGEGDLSKRAIVASTDEVGLLAQSFNGMLGALSDSTAALRKREEQFRTLAESMNEGLLQMDSDFVIKYANPRLYKMLGFADGDLEGQHISKITDPANLPDFAQADEISQKELQLTFQDNEIRWFLLSYSLSEDLEGTSNITIIFTDITLLKKTERDLVYKNRELDTFVYKASHDLKAPLSSLRGLVDIILEETPDPKAQRFLTLIDRTVQKMDDVLQGLLEVTWIKQGALESNDIHMNDLIQTILRSIAHAPGYDSVEFRIDIPDRYHVLSDAKMLNSILQNIIFNAIKYHRETGDDKWVGIKVVDFPKYAKISISDNGPGIPPAAQEKLFDMFYRASTKSQGSGLGLYIVKTSIEKMGGSVKLISEVGKGTEFVIELPKIEKKEAVIEDA